VNALLMAVAVLSAAAAQDTVSGSLERNEYLVRHHRGYLAYLARRPEMASAEKALASLLSLTGPHDAIVQFESALNANPGDRAAFDAFHAALAEDGALDAAMARLYRAERQMPPLSVEAAAALDYLHAHPAEALAFLEQPAHGTRPLLPLRQPLVNRDNVRREMKAAMEAIDKSPAAHAAVFPWWTRIANESAGLAQAHRQLVATFERHANWFWIWHRHAGAIQADPAARDWLRYWHIRISQEPALGPRYWQYVWNEQLAGQRRHSEDAWQAKYGKAPAWPPASPPPDITNQEPDGPAHKTPKSRLMPRAPLRPGKPAPDITMPAMPNKPARPARPPISK